MIPSAWTVSRTYLRSPPSSLPNYGSCPSLRWRVIRRRRRRREPQSAETSFLEAHTQTGFKVWNLYKVAPRRVSRVFSRVFRRSSSKARNKNTTAWYYVEEYTTFQIFEPTCTSLPPPPPLLKRCFPSWQRLRLQSRDTITTNNYPSVWRIHATVCRDFILFLQFARRIA